MIANSRKPGFVFPDKSLILFDPQAHSVGRQMGPSDGGVVVFDDFKRDHVCNTICRALKLPKLKKPAKKQPQAKGGMKLFID
jgi:hypothetical protein